MDKGGGGRTQWGEIHYSDFKGRKNIFGFKDTYKKKERNY